MGSVIIALTYFIITVLCVGMSTISTYYGFESMLGTLTLPLTIVVAAGLFACDIAILDRRSKGISILGPAFVLLVFTSLSAASNFNYFYSREMRKELAADRVVTATRVFENNMKAAETAVRKEMRALSEVRTEIQKERALLTAEIDNQRKGFGPEAQKYMDNIRGHLRTIGRSLVAFTPPRAPGTPEGNKAALAQFLRQVDDALTQAEKDDPWGRGLADIEQARADLAKALQATRALGLVDPAQGGIDTVREIGLITQRVERNVLQVFEMQQKPRPALALIPTPHDGIQLNDIMESLKSGFVVRPSPGKTAFAAAAALLVDLLPLIFALVLIRPKKKPRTRGAQEDEDDEAPQITGPKQGLHAVSRPEILNKEKAKQPVLRNVKG